ncbi:MAG: tetratricopeptide repeat protein [Chryseobacterium sp.]|nr:tetratricopeptide repeat protein [Chryseobacterium sp.]
MRYLILFIFLFFVSHFSAAPWLSSSLLSRTDLEQIITNKKRLLSDTVILKKKLQNSTSHKKIISETLLAQAYVGAFDGKNPKSEFHFKNSIETAVKLNNPALAIWAELNYAEYLYRYREMTRAMPVFLNALNAAEKIPANELLFPCWSFKIVGYYMGTIGDYDEAVNFLKMAQHYADRNSSELSEILDNIGQYYYLARNYIQAEKYYTSASITALQIKDELRYAKTLGNIALIRKGEGNYNSAVHLLKKDIEISERIGAQQNTMFAQIALVRVFIKAEKWNEAASLLQKAEAISRSRSYYMSSRREIAEIKLDLFQGLGRISEIPDIRREIKMLDDSLRLTDGEQTLNKTHLMTQKALYQQKITKANEKLSSRNNLLVIFVVVAGIGFVLLGWNLLRLKKNEAKRKLQYDRMITELEKEKVGFERTLMETRQTLQDQVQYLKSKNQYIEQLNSEIETIRLSASSHLEEKEGKLHQLLESHLMTEENWQIFRRQFQKEYPEFYGNLSGEFPEITPANLRVILLQKLGFSQVEISRLLGVTQDAVKKSRQRLKRKLGERYEKLSEMISAEF